MYRGYLLSIRLYIKSELRVVPDVSSAHSGIIFDGKMTLFTRCL